MSTENKVKGKPRLLDLFCGAGGAAMGYARAGFEVVGVDIHPQPRYPFEFHRADAIEFLESITPSIWHLAAIHASPPCQRFSDLAKRNGNAAAWPDLIAPVREHLVAAGLPYVIENVEGAPLLDPIVLCGAMFPELRVIRHRLFESNLPLFAPTHGAHPLVFTHDRRKAHYGHLDEDTAFVQVTGGGNASVANKRAAMGIDWMIGRELNEAIPLAYTEFIGRQLIAALAVAA
jgi:DNA (cytosine-5)-methyltransferase 1